MNIGTRVKYSPSALKSLRDGWQAEGSPSKKATKKKRYDDKAAMRGTITGTLKNGYSVIWDNGDDTQLLSYLITEA